MIDTLSYAVLRRQYIFVYRETPSTIYPQVQMTVAEYIF